MAREDDSDRGGPGPHHAERDGYYPKLGLITRSVTATFRRALKNPAEPWLAPQHDGAGTEKRPGYEWA